MTLVAALLLAQAAPAATGDRLEPLVPVPNAPAAAAAPTQANAPEPDAPSRACTADGGWCLVLDADSDTPSLTVRTGGTSRRYPLPDLPDTGEGDTSATTLWPMRLRLSGDKDDKSVIVGLVHEQRASYSGGGASASYLHLLRLSPDGTARIALSLPWAGWSMIRACFSEADQRHRAGACHDEYNFSAKLEVVPGGLPGAPLLRYSTVATSFPGAVSRSADSLARRPLRRRDLVQVVNEPCSIVRTFRADPATGLYAPDSPLPDCADYTSP